MDRPPHGNDPIDRLRRRQQPFRISPEAREQHLRAISGALETATPRRSRRVLAAWAAAVLTGLPAAAVASQGAVPGDVLYPVKRTAEAAWSLVDPDIAVRHRLEELEELRRRDGDPERFEALLDEARRQAKELDDDELRSEVEDTLERIERDRRGGDADDEDGGDGGDDDSSSSSTTSTTEPDDDDDGSTTSTTRPDDDDDGSTTSTTEPDDDGSTTSTTEPDDGSTTTTTEPDDNSGSGSGSSTTSTTRPDDDSTTSTTEGDDSP